MKVVQSKFNCIVPQLVNPEGIKGGENNERGPETPNLEETVTPTTSVAEGGLAYQHLPRAPVKTHLLLLGIHSWNRLVKNKAQKLLFLLKALLSQMICKYCTTLEIRGHAWQGLVYTHS